MAASIAAPDSSAKPAIELCCGLGGIGIGLRSLGFSVRSAYDSWDKAVAIYNRNCPDNVAERANLLSEEGWKAVKRGAAKAGEIELLAAGPPCKGFSRLLNGHHDGRNGHNRVLAAMPEYVALLKPRLIFIENVPDLARHRNGRTLSALLQRFANPTKGLRYRVEAKTYDASAYGTPQARKRIFIFGVRAGSGRECLPDPTVDLSPLYAAIRHGGDVPKQLRAYHDALRNPQDSRLVTAFQALSDLPDVEPGTSPVVAQYKEPTSAFQTWARQGAGPSVQDARAPGVKDETVSRLRHIPPGGCARSIPADYVNGLARRYDSAYRRLHPDAPSTALSTKYDCVYHYAADRSLSVREYARLQGLPDFVTFPRELVSRRSAYELIGNSVPPQLVFAVLGGALKALT